MDEESVAFWKGRTPMPEYFAPIDPYNEPPSCKYNLMELSRYARKVGKRIAELTYDEITQFSI